MQAGLLAVLLLNRGATVSLDVITDVLWPEGDFDSASTRNSLRVHMSNLRKWVREIAGEEAAARFRTDGDGYVLDLASSEFDVVAFEQLVNAGRTDLKNARLTGAHDSLAIALKMWAAPYPELEHYAPAESERVRLFELSELARDVAIEVQLRNGHASDVIGVLQARLIAHPFREQSYGQLMRALYAVGRQAEALATYQRARDCLRDELGLDPGPGLRDLESRILTHALESDASPSLDAVRSPFVGRDVELAAALLALSTSDFLIIAGEPGIGKTRLVEELKAQTGTATWIWTNSSSDRSTPPMWPILHALGLGSEPAADAASEFERNQRVLSELRKSGEHVVLVLEDFHWADEATVRFVRHLGRQSAESLVTIITTRSAPGHLESEAGKTVLDIRRQSSTHSIDLAALDLEAMKLLVQSVNASLPPTARLLERSAGNPLFLKELLSAGDDSVHVPPAIANVVLGRLDDATETTKQILGAAAVIDEEIDVSLLLRLGISSASEILFATEYGMRSALLTKTAHGKHVFAHSLLRDSLADLLSTADTCRIHDLVATEIAGRSDFSERDRYRLAHHAFHALPVGDAMRSVQASMHIGEIAARAFAFADARDHFRQAQAAADYLGHEQGRKVLPAVLCELGYFTVRAGDTRTGTALLVRAVEASRSIRDWRSFVRGARCLTEAGAPANTNDSTISEVVEEALARSTGDQTEDRVQLLVDLAGLRYFTHDVAARRTLCDEALELASAVGDRAVAIATTGTWAAIYAPETTEERMRLAATARTAARRSRSLDLSIHGATLEIATAFELGQATRARALIHQVHNEVESLQSPRLQWFGHGWGLLLKVLDGDLDAADSDAHLGLEMWDSTHPDALAAFAGQLSMIRALQDRLDELVGLLRNLVIEVPDNQTYAVLLANALCDHEPDEALSMTNRVADEILVGRLRSSALTTTTLAFLAEAISRMPAFEPERAIGLIKHVTPLCHLHTVVDAFGTCGMYWGSLHHAHGLLLSSAGHAEQAKDAFHLAADEHERIGARLFARRSRAALERHTRSFGLDRVGEN